MEKYRILTYHRIGIPRTRRYEKFTVPPWRFARQAGILQLLGYQFLSLDNVASWLKGEQKKAGRPVVLTFDDGYEDLYDHAFPVLRAQQITAVVFLVVERQIDAWNNWGDKGPLNLLSWPKVKEMSDAGIVFGSHTLTHPHLTRCNEKDLRAEVTDSKKIIEDRLGREVRHFCYPYSDYDERVEDMVREAGFATACTTQKGAVLAGTDPLRLPRLTVGKRMGLHRFLLRLMFRH